MIATIADPLIDPVTTGIPFLSATVLARRRRGNLKFLIMRTVKKYGKDAGLELWKVPGGMQEFSDSANPLRTLNRELEEETGFYLRPDHKVDPPVLQRERTPDGHFRYFYLLWRNDVRGELRTSVKEDDKSILYVPTWEDIEFFEKYLCKSQRGILFKLRRLSATGSLC